VGVSGAPGSDRLRPRQGLRHPPQLDLSLLDQHPDFLRLLIVLALQPPAGDEHDVHTVVGRLRDTARTALAAKAAIAFGIRPDSKKAKQLARVALAYFDGAFVAAQSDDGAELGRLLAHLPASLVAVHERL
jgi:hypothetical protein